MKPPVQVGRDFQSRSATRYAYAVVTNDHASMRGFVLGCLACLAIIGFALYAYVHG